MERPPPWQLFLAAILSSGSGCGFDTAPLQGSGPGTASATSGAAGGSWLRDAAVADPRQSSSLVPISAGAASAGSSAAIASSAGASAPPIPLTPTSSSAAQPTQVPSVPTAPLGPVASAAGAPASMPPRCEPVGSYGLRLDADLSWEGSANGLADPGRGHAELFVLLDVSQVDAQTGAVSATGRLCGLTLPAMTSPLSCNAYEYRFADKLWEQRELPALMLQGRYDCAADSCRLQLTPPFSYVLGIQLPPGRPDWPDAGTAPASQVPDHDTDGLPGVSAEIISQASAVPSANPNCSYTPLGVPTGGAGAAAESTTGRVLLGLHAQLGAAMDLAADCRVTRGTGALQALNLRAAGCQLNTVPWNPAQGNPPGAGDTSSACTEEVRSVMDEALPSYHVLADGEAPRGGTLRDVSISRGPVLQAVRFGPGPAPSCEQVRKAMF